MKLCEGSPIVLNPISTYSERNAKPDAVIDRLKSKAAGQRAYRLCEIALDTDFSVTWSDSPIRLSPASLKRFCAIVGVPLGLLKSESAGGTKSQRRITELVNDRLSRMEEGFTAVIDSNTGTIEGVMSPKYKRLPNVEAAEFVMKSVNMEEYDIARFRMEETRMALDFATKRNDGTPDQKALLKVGDPIRAGFSLSNSEDADAMVDMSTYIERLRCLNGAVMAEKGAGGSVRHIGKAFYQRFATLLAATQNTTRSVFGDIVPMRAVPVSAEEGEAVRAVLSSQFSDRVAGRIMSDAATNADELVGVVQNNGKHDPLTTEAGNLISVYNIWNGITFQGHDAPTIDRRRTYEAFGGAFIRQWRSLVAVN